MWNIQRMETDVLLHQMTIIRESFTLPTAHSTIVTSLFTLATRLEPRRFLLSANLALVPRLCPPPTPWLYA